MTWDIYHSSPSRSIRMNVLICLLCLISVSLVALVAIAKCPEEACESGLSCDFNTGLCQRFRIPDGFQLFDNWNKCEFVKCPDGYKCDGTSGICTRKSSQVLLANDYCDGIECPPDFSCITGRCVKNPDPSQSEIFCQEDLNCPEGSVCSVNGTCKQETSHSDVILHDDDTERPFQIPDLLQIFYNNKAKQSEVKCPPNSHFVSCGTPCTFTCTNVKPKCKQTEHECLKTCVCNDGYVQVSALNTTCVKAKECIRIAAEDSYSCENLKCSHGMKCLAGHCNPEHCPEILKPAINSECHKLVVARNRQNCIALVNECDIYE